MLVQAPHPRLLSRSRLPRRNETPHTNPVIGIMAQLERGEHGQTMLMNKDGVATEIIVVSYVKYLEAAGARVVPISSTNSQQQLQDLCPNLNGLLVPGMKSCLNTASQTCKDKMREPHS